MDVGGYVFSGTAQRVRMRGICKVAHFALLPWILHFASTKQEMWTHVLCEHHSQRLSEETLLGGGEQVETTLQGRQKITTIPWKLKKEGDKDIFRTRTVC